MAWLSSLDATYDDSIVDLFVATRGLRGYATGPTKTGVDLNIWGISEYAEHSEYWKPPEGFIVFGDVLTMASALCLGPTDEGCGFFIEDGNGIHMRSASIAAGITSMNQDWDGFVFP